MRLLHARGAGGPSRAQQRRLQPACILFREEGIDIGGDTAPTKTLMVSSWPFQKEDAEPEPIAMYLDQGMG